MVQCLNDAGQHVKLRRVTFDINMLVHSKKAIALLDIKVTKQMVWRMVPGRYSISFTKFKTPPISATSRSERSASAKQRQPTGPGSS